MTLSGAGRRSTRIVDNALRAIANTEEEAARQMMSRIKVRGHPKTPPAIATDGKGAYPEAMVETWGKVPPRKPTANASDGRRADGSHLEYQRAFMGGGAASSINWKRVDYRKISR